MKSYSHGAYILAVELQLIYIMNDMQLCKRKKKCSFLWMNIERCPQYIITRKKNLPTEQ